MSREPLIHFLIGGAVIFAAFLWIGEPVDPASRTIEVSREEQAQIALQFQRTMQRPPTDAELDRQIELWVRDEVLYREALRLGLDQGDPIFRQRLSRKMEELAASSTEFADPGDAVLQQWLEDNPQRFLPEYRVSFEQEWFEKQLIASGQLISLGREEIERPEGGSISLPAMVEDMSAKQVEARFGRQFAQGLARVDANGEWQRPIPSGFGWHLVRLTDRSADAAELAPIREKVLNDWRFRTAFDRKDQAYELLRDAYSVNVAE